MFQMFQANICRIYLSVTVVHMDTSTYGHFYHAITTRLKTTIDLLQGAAGPRTHRIPPRTAHWRLRRMRGSTVKSGET